MSFKIILSVLTLAAVSGSFGGPLIRADLNAARVNIGAMSNGTEATNRIVRVTRSARTPTKVTVDLSFDISSQFCTQQDTQSRYIEGSWQDVCSRDANGDAHCRNEYVPGHTVYEEVCVAWGDRARTSRQTFILDFNKAAPLAGNATETFDVHFAQGNKYNGGLDFSGSVVKAAASYEIKSRAALFVRRGLKFIAR